MRALFAQLVRFGLVGCVGLVVDAGVFNLLRATLLSPEDVHNGVIYARIISTTLAIIVNWLGNRFWTFGDRRRPHIVREAIEFAVVSVGGLLIGLATLWVSHYLLGFTSVLADNIANYVVGLVLGTAFRFTLYRVWVFSDERTDPVRRIGSDADNDEVSDSPTRSSRRRRATPRPVAERQSD